MFLDPEDIADAPAFCTKQDATPAAPSGLDESFRKDSSFSSTFAPFKNEFDFHMAHWHLSSYEKSYLNTDGLVHQIMCALFFNKEEIPSTWSCKATCEVLNNLATTTPLPFSLADRWTAVLHCHFLAGNFRTILKLKHPQSLSAGYGFVTPLNCWNQLWRTCHFFPPTWKDFARCGKLLKTGWLYAFTVRPTCPIFTGTWRLSWLLRQRRDQTRPLLRQSSFWLRHFLTW